MNVNHICFIVAMQQEAEPLIEQFQLEADDSFVPHLPPLAWRGRFRNREISLVINGRDRDIGMDLIGTQAATLSTHLAIEKYKPHLIINAGTAGAFGEKGAQIGDIYLSRKHIVYHDRRVPIEPWDRQCIGYYPVWDVSPLARPGFKTGIVTTGNSLDLMPVDEEMIRSVGGEIKDMEAAAIAWVAQLYGIPMFCVKAVTDLVDAGEPTPDQFKANLHLATQNLKEACFRILEKLLKKQS